MIITVFSISWSQVSPNRNFNQIPDWKHYFVFTSIHNIIWVSNSVMGWSNIVATTLYTYEMEGVKDGHFKTVQASKECFPLTYSCKLEGPSNECMFHVRKKYQQRLKYVKTPKKLLGFLNKLINSEVWLLSRSQVLHTHFPLLPFSSSKQHQALGIQPFCMFKYPVNQTIC